MFSPSMTSLGFFSNPLLSLPLDTVSSPQVSPSTHSLSVSSSLNEGSVNVLKTSSDSLQQPKKKKSTHTIRLPLPLPKPDSSSNHDDILKKLAQISTKVCSCIYYYYYIRYFCVWI
jgi:hypothetical protein